MLSLDIENSILNPAAVRALKDTRLGELKRNFAVYFGFTTPTELANYFALSQAIGTANANETGNTARDNRAPGLNEGVRGAINDLSVRTDPELAPVFAKLLDYGGGARKILDVDQDVSSSVRVGLDQLLSAVTNEQKANRRHAIARCVKLHYAENVVGNSANNLEGSPDKIFYSTLDRAIPSTGDAQKDTEIRRRLCALQMINPLLVPGEKNSELLTVFFNAMPTLEMTRATPVMNIKFYSSRQAIEDNKLAAITLQKFVEGARDVGQNTPENLPLRAISLASQIPTGSVPGDFGGGRDFQNFTVAGLELFRAPQTLVNIEATKNKENYLAPVIDPMRPLASIKSFSIDIKSAYGLQGTRSATLEIILHDRSRMGEFADFIKPDRYGESFLEVEYGWLHPDPMGQNPYADLLNLTRAIDHFTVVTSNFNFDDVGQVNITLNLIGRGSSEITELSIVGQDSAGRIQQQIREVQRLSETINRLSGLVFPSPPENQNNRNQRRREIRGIQGLSAAGDATNNLVLSRDTIRELHRLQQTLASRTGRNVQNPALRENARQLQSAINLLVGQNIRENANAPGAGAITNVTRTINQEVREILNRINLADGRARASAANYYNDSFLETMPPFAWNTLKNGNFLTQNRIQPSRQETPTGQLPSTGNNAATAGDGAVPVERFSANAVVSLGTLVTAFIGKPLASLKNPDGSQKFEEVQLYFYNFNNKASLMSHCNISQFPVKTDFFVREYGRMRMENVGRTVNLSVNEFINFIATKIVDDPLSPGYGIASLYKYERNELVPAHSNTFDNQMYTNMRINNIGHHSDFTMPQLTFDIEATQAVVNNRVDEGKTILKIHIYDKACSPNSSFRELLTLGTSNVMGVLSAYAGDDPQRRATESQAAQNGESVELLRENWRVLHSRLVEECRSMGLIENMRPLQRSDGASFPQYRFVGGAQKLKEFVMKSVPHIIYGAMGTTIRTATVSSMSDPNLNTVNMLRSLSASPIQPNGEQTGGVPLSVYPVELSMTSLGCPFLRYGQELFVDYNTNTSIDNIYYITGLQHKIEAGSFETTIKFTANDAFGQYRNLIGQLNTAETSLSNMQGESIPPSTNQRR